MAIFLMRSHTFFVSTTSLMHTDYATRNAYWKKLLVFGWSPKSFTLIDHCK